MRTLPLRDLAEPSRADRVPAGPGAGAGIYFPAISATIQRQLSGDVRSRAFGYLGGVVGISTDWASDIVPHLGYGAAACATLAALDNRLWRSLPGSPFSAAGLSAGSAGS